MQDLDATMLDLENELDVCKRDLGTKATNDKMEDVDEELETKATK